MALQCSPVLTSLDRPELGRHWLSNAPLDGIGALDTITITDTQRYREIER